MFEETPASKKKKEKKRIWEPTEDRPKPGVDYVPSGKASEDPRWDSKMSAWEVSPGVFLGPSVSNTRMNEASQDDNSTQLSDEERISEFTVTGDPDYLTPELAKRMRLSPEIMREVPGATEEDVEETRLQYEEEQNVINSEIDEELKSFGADYESLEKKDIHGQFRALLDAATASIADTRTDSGMDFEIVRDEALQRMVATLRLANESMYRLFEVLNLYSPQGMRDIGAVQEMIASLKYGRENGDRYSALALEDLLDVADRTLYEFEFQPKANYLGSEMLKQMLVNEIEQKESETNDDIYIPFELTTDQYATFSDDLDRIFVVDAATSEEIHDSIYAMSALARESKDDTEDSDRSTNKFGFTREQMFDFADGIIDVGTSLDTITKQLGINNPDLMKDYITLLRSGSRNIIETKFNFTLSALSIKEQFYFLNYLKNVEVAEAEKMQHFTSLYGVDGMRTFFSLERGDEELGDQIVTFGQHEEVATRVFQYYGELLDSAERAEELVRQVSDCEGNTCVEPANQVRENILNRAQKDLEKAVRAQDPSEVTAQIQDYITAAKEYVALLQEVGAGKIETISSAELKPEDQEQMRTLLKNNYDKIYTAPGDDNFKAAVADSLEKGFADQNTTFRVLRDNGKIVSYNRFDTLRNPDGKEISYFGSFNADPAYSGIGGVMLEETIKDRLGDGRSMMAHCDPEQVITRKYIENGFIATDFYKLAGKPSFEIWRSKGSAAQLESKDKTIEELLNMATRESKTITVRERSESEQYPELGDGMALTRYFTHEGRTYLVFETLPDTLRNDFVAPQEEKKKAA